MRIILLFFNFNKKIMPIEIIRQDKISIIDVNVPRTSIYLVNDFKELIFKEIEEGIKNIIVDFTRCDFLDSTFLGVLVVSHKKLFPVNGKIILVINNQNILISLELTRMNKIFDIYPTIEEALDKAKQQ